MIVRNWDLYKQIKNIGWTNREAWLNVYPGEKFLSTYAINGALEKPKDWLAIATKCSNNPNHEHFSKKPEEIMEIWKNSGAKGQKRGTEVDDYITNLLNNNKIIKPESMKDEVLMDKFKNIDRLAENVLSSLGTFIGPEIWLTSAKLGISVRCDSLFTTTNDRNILIAEWKNNEKLGTYSWDKLLGPASHLLASDLVKFTIQTHIYRYILEEYEMFDKIYIRIFQIAQQDYYIHKEAFDYSRGFIEDIVLFTKEQRLLEARQNE